MASEVAGMTNGTYAPHQHQPYVDQNAYAYAANNHVSQPPTAATPQQQPQQVPPTSSTPSNAPTAAQPEIPKDEVGWYFVEQYYTTLSRSPEKLYLFYNKRSQFVSGQETDKVAVCVGQRAINDKIKELDFLDCKVRVTNVDSQASDSNIVIQVIGELSNRGQPHKKFTQTFVLATQTNGYFVLNDIFRYLVEEEDEPETETQQAAEEVQQVPGTESGYQEPVPTEVEPKTLTSSADPAAIEHDAKEVDKEIEEKLVNANQAEDAPVAAVNGEPVAEKVEETPAAQAEPEVAVEAEPPSSADVDIEPEKPKDPEPSPIPTPAKEAAAPAQQAAPAPAPKPAAPAAPKTWASLAASANRVATPAAPAIAPPAAAPAARQAPKTATVAPAAPSATAQSATPSGPAAHRQEAQGSDSQDEWTAVGSSHNRQQSRQTNNVAQQETAQWRGYIKNVHDHIDFDKLKAELEQIGEVTYFDIARQKNCAFVDFKTKEGYEKARSTPFKIGDDEFIVEERRFKPGATPYIPRGQYQGGRGGGRGNFQAQRGGNAAPRGRGGFPRGRGGAQA